MKVIFLQDVPRVAQAGEVKEVSNGYGRNYLLPRKLAALATPGELRRLEAWRQAQERRRAEEERQLQELATTLEGVEVVVEARAGESGQLFGSVTAADIAEAVGRHLGAEIDKRKVELEENLKQVGEHRVAIRLSPELAPAIKVIVKAAES